MTWNPPATLPRQPGWYIVRRVDSPEFGERARAWGKGAWWTPLPDGWMAHVDPASSYAWRDGPVCAIADKAEQLTPIQEMERAEAVYRALNPQSATGGG